MTDQYVCLVTRSLPLLARRGLSSLDRNVERKIILPFPPFPSLVVGWETPAALRDEDSPDIEWVDVDYVSFRVDSGTIMLVSPPDENTYVGKNGMVDDELHSQALEHMEQIVLPAYQQLGWKVTPVDSHYDALRSRYRDDERPI